MPRSKSRDRKTSDQNSSQLSSSRTSRSPNVLQLELENVALKAKNADLVKGHVKLLQENQELKNEVMDVKAQFFTMQAKYNNVASGLGKLESELEKCTPSIIEILNLILQANKDISGNKPAKAKNVTIHSVKPHIVNGTVLNLNPTITLNRMSNNEQDPRLDPRPSTSSAVFENEIFDNGSPNILIPNDENISPRDFTTRDKNAPVVQMEEDENSDQMENYLSAIPEETSMDRSNSIGEVRICLKRLSHQEISRLSKNDSSSTEMNVNDTCFNIEATIIEDGDVRVSKTVSADISFSSPNGNSTHISNDEYGLSAANSRLVSRRKYTSASNNTATSTMCGNESRTPNLLLDLPTPSMFCIGDIGDKNDGSKLAILQDRSGSDPSSAMVSAIKSSESPPSITKKKRQAIFEQESPRSSRSTEAGYKRRRRWPSESDISMSPRVLLERADSPSSDLSCQEEDDVKENNKVVVKTKKSEPLKRNKKTEPLNRTQKSDPLKRTQKSDSLKRNKKSETLTETKKRQKTSKTTKELQVKLSNFLPEASPRRTSTESVQSDYGEGRPRRAARPTQLKDASLKTKMRRMI